MNKICVYLLFSLIVCGCQDCTCAKEDWVETTYFQYIFGSKGEILGMFPMTVKDCAHPICNEKPKWK